MPDFSDFFFRASFGFASIRASNSSDITKLSRSVIRFSKSSLISSTLSFISCFGLYILKRLSNFTEPFFSRAMCGRLRTLVSASDASSRDSPNICLKRLVCFEVLVFAPSSPGAFLYAAGLSSSILPYFSKCLARSSLTLFATPL